MARNLLENRFKIARLWVLEALFGALKRLVRRMATVVSFLNNPNESNVLQ